MGLHDHHIGKVRRKDLRSVGPREIWKERQTKDKFEIKSKLVSPIALTGHF